MKSLFLNKKRQWLANILVALSSSFITIVVANLLFIAGGSIYAGELITVCVFLAFISTLILMIVANMKNKK
jgi:hypothetical protein